MAQIDFADYQLDTNEVLLAQVVSVLNDLQSQSPSDISSAIRYFNLTSHDLRTNAARLLYCYQRIWRPRRGVGFYLRTPICYPLRALIKIKADLEDAAQDSVLHKTALEIVEEFMLALGYWHTLKQFKSVQRRVLSRNHQEFFDLLVSRDGKQCAHCKSKRKKLLIDHKKPVAVGGLTELSNLQLLCFGCKSKKSHKFPYPLDAPAVP